MQTTTWWLVLWNNELDCVVFALNSWTCIGSAAEGDERVDGTPTGAHQYHQRGSEGRRGGRAHTRYEITSPRLGNRSRKFLTFIFSGNSIVDKLCCWHVTWLQASLKWKQNQLDTNKQNVSSQIAAMNAATASVITLTSGTVLSTHFCFVLSLICLFYYYYLFFFFLCSFFGAIHFHVLSGCRAAGGCGSPSRGCGYIDHLVKLAGNGQRRQAHLCFDGRRGARRPPHGRYASTLQGILRPAGCRQAWKQQCKIWYLIISLSFFDVPPSFQLSFAESARYISLNGSLGSSFPFVIILVVSVSALTWLTQQRRRKRMMPQEADVCCSPADSFALTSRA